jgi:anti-sigma factor RsiW
MTEQDLRNEWAWSQIEGYADGSLRGAARARMRAAVRHDMRLRAAVERARRVRTALRAAPAAPLPSGLRARLLRIPGPPMRRWPALAATAAAAAAIAVLAWQRPEPAPPPVDERAAAVADFQLAMKYVQKSAAITSKEVSTQVGGGLREALTLSGNSLRASAERTKTGG